MVNNSMLKYSCINKPNKLIVTLWYNQKRTLFHQKFDQICPKNVKFPF